MGVQRTVTLYDVEEAKRALDYEVGTLLSHDGNVIREYRGDTHGVSYPPEDAPLFEGGVFTHNHPSGRTFTLEDIKTFIRTGLREARVSTPQGGFFSLKESETEINKSIAGVMEAEKAGTLMQAARLVQREMSETGVELAGEDYQKRLFDVMAGEVDRWLIENAREFGYIYSQGRIG